MQFSQFILVTSAVLSTFASSRSALAFQFCRNAPTAYEKSACEARNESEIREKQRDENQWLADKKAKSDKQLADKNAESERNLQSTFRFLEAEKQTRKQEALEREQSNKQRNEWLRDMLRQ